MSIDSYSETAIFERVVHAQEPTLSVDAIERTSILVLRIESGQRTRRGSLVPRV